MPNPKKIFFSYSNQDEDLELYNKIHKHFAAYAGIGLIGIIDKKEIFRLTSDKSQVIEILKTSDITIPLLSIDFINDEECLHQLESAAVNQKVIVPVLLRDFDWEAFQKIMLYKERMLPNDLTSVEKHINTANDDDTVFKEIAQSIKALIFPEIRHMEIQRSPNTFYYILASLVFVIGIIASVIVYHQTDGFQQTERILFTTACLLMFVCIGFISLKNVLFPSKIKIKPQP